MRSLLLILALLSMSCMSFAKTKSWDSPHVGYSNTNVMSIDKVEFSSKATVVYASVEGRGSSVAISANSYLAAGPKHYSVVKAEGIKLGKYFSTPYSGKVSFKLFFEPMPSDTKLIHFAEATDDQGWKLCNVREETDISAMEKPKDWQNVVNSVDDSLPLSVLSDDSTSIRVKILNYTNEAGKNILLQMSSLDDGSYQTIYTFPINDDGTAEIKLHPCFPLTVLMGIGCSEKSPIVIVPGGDLSVLVDMEQGKTGLAAVAFKGTMAETNYNLNVLGLKELASFDNSTAHLDSLLHDTKNTFYNEASERLYKNKLKIEQACGNASADMLRILNECAYVEHKRVLSSYTYYKLKDYLDGQSLNQDVMFGIACAAYVRDLEQTDNELAVSERFTLSPCFASSDLYPNFYNQRLRFQHWDIGNNTFATAQYNYDVYRLFMAINSYVSKSQQEKYLQESIKTKELQDYYTLFKSRWQKTVADINSIPHVHYCQHMDKNGEDLRNAIRADYKGKSVVFVLYDLNSDLALNKLKAVEEAMEKSDSNNVAFIMIPSTLGFPDRNEWLRFIDGMPGEHYGTTSLNMLFLFTSKDSNSYEGIFCEVYDPEGKCTISTDNEKKAVDAILKLQQ